MRFSSSRGQAAVEFALVLPILLLLVTGIIDFGMLFLTKSQVEAASAMGARMVTLGTGTTTMKNDVVADYPGTNVDDPSYYPTDAVGDDVTVTVYKEYHILTPIIASFFPSGVTVTSSTTMVVEEVPPS